jgi:hypothetical protein
MKTRKLLTKVDRLTDKAWIELDKARTKLINYTNNKHRYALNVIRDDIEKAMVHLEVGYTRTLDLDLQIVHSKEKPRKSFVKKHK